MKFKIFGHKELEKFLKENPNKHECLYYTSSSLPELDFVKKNTTESLHLPVDDVDRYFKEEVGVTSVVSPKACYIKKALDFAEGKKNLIIACHAGICRSSATAYLIAAKQVGAIKALETLTPTQHYPNRLIVYIGSRVLKNPDIWNKYVDWYSTWNYADPSRGGTWPTEELISQMELE